MYSMRRPLAAPHTLAEVFRMAYVVTAPCHGCKYTDCVVVCPCECFHEGEQMLYIDPEECIDCGACLPECPVEAIFYEEDVPEPYRGSSPSTPICRPSCRCSR